MDPNKRTFKSLPAGELTENFPNVERTFVLHNNKRATGDVAYPLRAVYPMLNADQKAITMAAYNLYVRKYNKTANEVNWNNIGQINAAKKHLKTHHDPSVVINERKKFNKDYGDLDVWAFNKKVLEYNKMSGVQIIPTKRVRTIKQTSERVFHAILWVYSQQFTKAKRKKRAMEHKTGAYKKDLPKVDINTNHILNARDRFGVHLIDLCQDTVLNHKKRLIEAGVLLNNRYRGWERGTIHHINPEILAVLDDHTGKMVFSDNQILINETPKIFRVVDIPTRTINKTQVKRDVEKTSRIGKKDARESDTSADLAPVFLSCKYPSDISTRPPGSKVKNPKLAGTGPKKGALEENPKKTEDRGAKFSDDLREKILFPKDFTDSLANGEFLDHAPLPYEVLQMEVDTGNLSRSEFRQLLLQDLFKLFSKLYRGHPHFDRVFAKVWYNAYTLWEKGTPLMNRNGDTLHKDKCLLAYQKLRFVTINKKFGALHVARRSKFVFPAPTTYLNLDNNTPGTFIFYYKKVERDSLESIKRERELRKKMRKKGRENRLYANALRKLNDKMAKYYNGRISVDELFRYIEDNMPKCIQLDFDKHFTNYVNNRTA